MGVNDKVRTDLDLHRKTNLGIWVYSIERANAKVGYAKYESSTFNS